MDIKFALKYRNYFKKLTIFDMNDVISYGGIHKFIEYQ